MKSTYIYLNYDYEKILIKISKQKRLSFSAIVNIIVKHYQFSAARYGNKYQKKGMRKIHLKLKDENNYPDLKRDILATNCIYEWIEKPNKECNYKEVDRKMQSELDTTTDPFYDYNETCRKMTRMARENPNYLRRLLKEKIK